MKLGKRQIDLLRRIVATNGGGLCVSSERDVAKSLQKNGLIQGKSGQQFLAVHTTDGLKIVRGEK